MPMPTIVLIGATQTCASFPSQWDAVDVFGQTWLLHYRNGCGTVARDPSSQPFVIFHTGDPLDGTIDLITFARHARIVLALN